MASFTDSPTPTDRQQQQEENESSNADYVEIDDINLNYRPSENNVQQAKSYPALNTCNITNENENTLLNTTSSSSQRIATQDMGQTLSLRRPRISLTWVLREQQNQQQQSQQNQQQQEKDNAVPEKSEEENKQDNNNLNAKKQTTLKLETSIPLENKTYRIKQLPSNADPLNGYATTPSGNASNNMPVFSTKKFFSNQNLLEHREAITKSRNSQTASKELLFVCTPQRLPNGFGDTSDALALAKKRNDLRKKMASKLALSSRKVDGVESNGKFNTTQKNALSNEKESLKGTYSEPSLIAASEGQSHRRHRHRKRRERNRIPRFGYEIKNVDEFLSKCSLSSPGNIPVVLSTASTLYQTRPGGYQMEIPLPLGMVVNAVFKNENWLYVQTPHAEEGYVAYMCCLPLGILPPQVRGGSSKTTPCWESNKDVFPKPCGNMTDSEKEIRLRGGTRSEGARTPNGKKLENAAEAADSINGNIATGHVVPHESEQLVDTLYLRAASQPKIVEKAYAQLKSLKSNASTRSFTDEYVTLQQQQQQQHQKIKIHTHKHKHSLQQSNSHKHLVQIPYITNDHNGQHLHPNTKVHTIYANPLNAITQNSVVKPQHHHHQHLNQTVINAIRNKQPQGQRQTLVAINADYETDSISLKKGEIVTLCECRQSKDLRQWFYVKTRDGREGYIPAEVAGHGYL